MTKRKISLILVLSLMMSIVFVVPVFADNNIEFNFNKTPAVYDRLETIEGIGKVENVISSDLGKSITYTVESKNGLSIFKLGQDIMDQNGKFNVDFRLPRSVESGFYYLRMNIGGVHKEYEFEITGGSELEKPDSKTEEPIIKVDDKGKILPTSPSKGETKTPTKPTDKDKDTGNVKEREYQFADIKKHWARDEIQDLVDLKIVNGMSYKEFQPNRNITRAEFTKIIVEALKLEDVDSKDTFKDVKSSDWYGRYVEIAVKNKLVKGISKDEFAPNKEITREEMSTIIYRAIEDKKEGKYENSFKDREEIADWSMEAIDYISHIGIVKGDEQNKFRPKKPATRAESSVMIWRFLKIK